MRKPQQSRIRVKRRPKPETITVNVTVSGRQDASEWLARFLEGIPGLSNVEVIGIIE